MESKITISGVTKRVVLERAGEASLTYRVTFPDDEGKRETRVLRSLRLLDSVEILSLDDRVHIVHQVRRTPTSVEFSMDGRRVLAFSGAGRPAGSCAGGQASGVASVGEVVSANFPAKVVKILVRAGERVMPGDPIMVLEAMKMEAQVRTPMECAIREVYVKEGDMVERGTKLARLEFSP